METSGLLTMLFKVLNNITLTVVLVAIMKLRVLDH